MTRSSYLIFAGLLVLAAPAAYAQSTGLVQPTGELKRWHKVTLTFDGPAASESAGVNPFLNYRLDVTFSIGSKRVKVPGYYAADGNAAETSAVSGNKWRVHFVPDTVGTWTWAASFRTGVNVAVDPNQLAGAPTAFDGMTGSFNIAASDKTGADHRGKGLLKYTGKRYYQFAGTGERFLKAGADSPENFLAYYEFDGTPAKHYYNPHSGDWKTGDPVWQGFKGRNIIGALNYLASKGVNAVYFLTMNVGGDGKDVWPWTSSTERVRFDCSKLDQWEIVFQHMDRLGILLHVVMQERENDRMLDSGALGTQRKLYYRELIARFGHHLALTWNLGEEGTNPDAQRKEFATYIRTTDSYSHPIVVHTYPGEQELRYGPLLGFPNVEGPSLQISSKSNSHSEALKWLARSGESGRQWVVTVDEIGPANSGVLPDLQDPHHDDVRKQALWGTLMAGGAGVEWYFGYSYSHNDLTLEDHRSRDRMWTQTKVALDFFRTHLPFGDMINDDAATSSTGDFVLSKAGEIYAIYLPTGGTTNLNLGTMSRTYSVHWFDPRVGGALQRGSVTTIQGAGLQSIGVPPSQTSQDWVALVRAEDDLQMFPLSVSGGSGSGSHPAGAQVPITAADVSGRVFDQWVGSVAGLQNAYSPSTTFIMPAAAATLTATHKTGGLKLASFTLINSDTNLPVEGFDPIAPGSKLNLRTLPTRNLNIRANTDPQICGSVHFEYTGGAKTENVRPYAMAGDPNGDYANWTPALGTFQVSATPYTGINRTGTIGTPLVMSISVVDEAVPTSTDSPTVASLTLMDAVTNRPIPGFDPIQPGAVVDRSALRVLHMNVRANPGTAPVGSVYFSTNFGLTRLENSAPYSLAGDADGDYAGWTPAAGTYAVSATPYSGLSRGGSAGKTTSVTFTVR
ncbi:MAG TPA: DUF5060 domain-containing protein [Bryobacteraceae bacterium]|nr:DUF5060 domain-containing protein [Bryobacteraceae bacterium]